MRKHTVAAICVCLGFLLVGLTPVHAGGFPFATEFTQLLNYGQLLTSTAQQAQQVYMQTQQLEQELKNGQLLTSQIYPQISGEISQLGNAVMQGQAMAYSMSNLDTEFANRFQGYGYATPQNFSQAYQNWAQTSFDTTRSTMAEVGAQNTDLQNSSELVEQLEQQAQSSTGQLQALQVIAEISAQEVSELQKLRALMLADIASKQTFQQKQLQTQMSSQDITKQFFQVSTVDNSDQTRY